MRFVVDAQLPLRLAWELSALGHDVTHTNDLALGNRTPDTEIIALADREDRIVVTKDSDFVRSFFLNGRPRKLLLISTGNISNDSLSEIMIGNMPSLEEAFNANNFIEINVTSMLMRG